MSRRRAAGDLALPRMAQDASSICAWIFLLLTVMACRPVSGVFPQTRKCLYRLVWLGATCCLSTDMSYPQTGGSPCELR